MRIKIIGCTLIAIALLIIFAVSYRNSQESETPIVFSEAEMMRMLWITYKDTYLEEDTYRTVDTGREDVTTSEGQSYTMLRAVWMDDKETFDGAWQWTKDNLRREEDRLFSWLFGERADGTYGVLTDEGGNNTASDADVDIALALVFAYARWSEAEYLGDARVIINDIWEQEVIVVDDTPYLAANNVEKEADKEFFVANPSYLAPYAYRIFGRLDPEHDWGALVDSSYDLIERSMEAELGTGEEAGLPPDWVEVSKETGEIREPENDELATHYGFEALRTPWRIALDYKWFDEERAQELLSELDFLSEEWEQEQKLYSQYNRNGSALTQDETPAMYGGSIGYFIVADSARAHDVYEQRLQALYDPDARSWEVPLSYYDDNWAWFGLGLYNDLLPNLAASIDWDNLMARN